VGLQRPPTKSGRRKRRVIEASDAEFEPATSPLTSRMHWACFDGIIPVAEPASRTKGRGASEVRVQIYTNDREQPIDLEVLEMHTKVRGINTIDNGQQREPSVDQTVREVIKDPLNGSSANLLFTTLDGREGAIYLNTDKVAAVVTSWSSAPSTDE
jgi:hypothetical protein